MNTYEVEFGLANEPSMICVPVKAPNSSVAITAAVRKAEAFGYDIDHERGCGVRKI